MSGMAAAVPIRSSLTMALAVREDQKGKRQSGSR
jgi:hypothetical protein